MSEETKAVTDETLSSKIGNYYIRLSKDRLVIESKSWFAWWGNLLLIAFISSVFLLATPELIETYKEEGWSANLISSVLILSFIQILFILLIFSLYLFKKRLYFTPNELTIERRVGRTRVINKSEVLNLIAISEGKENKDKIVFVKLAMKNGKTITLVGFSALSAMPGMNVIMVDKESSEIIMLIEGFWEFENERDL